MLDHCENTDGLGAIFPPMVYSIIALRSLDYDLDSPMVQWALHQLDDLHIAEDDRVRIQPCVSPVWDTAIVSIALADAQVPADHPAWARAIRWLLAKEIREPGDWQIRRPGVEPTGWHFQFHNAFYPDLDDSAMVILALNRSPLADEPAVQAATRRGVNWLLSMQNRDGGWAAYDIDIDNQVLTQLPFADHNAMLDPSCADITARVVEMLGHARLSRRPSGRRPRARLFVEHAGAGRLLVRPLGRELHLRNVAGLAGPEGHRLPHGSPRACQGRGLARIGAAALGCVGRNLPQLRRPHA